MKVLHATAFLTPSAGQLSQLTWEHTAALAAGLEWDTKVYCPQGSLPPSPITCFSSAASVEDRRTSCRKASAWFRFRRAYYSWLREIAHQYDVLLLRYYFHDPYQYAFAHKCPQPIYFVHHTLEVPEMLSSRTATGFIRGVSDALLGPATLRMARGVIGVTREIAEYECARAHMPTLRLSTYPNGIDYMSGSVVGDDRSGAPALLFVAGTFAVWQGLDDLLNALRASDEKVILHLVGHVPESLRAAAQLDRRVVLHGTLERAELQKVAASCDAGLSSFRLDRKRMRQACTLKVRDYLRMGLPVYAGYEDVFPPSFPYFRRGVCAVGSMAAYARQCRLIPRVDVAEAARPFIDKQAIMKNLMAFISADADLQ